LASFNLGSFAIFIELPKSQKNYPEEKVATWLIQIYINYLTNSKSMI